MLQTTGRESLVKQSNLLYEKCISSISGLIHGRAILFIFFICLNRKQACFQARTLNFSTGGKTKCVKKFKTMR